jgi:hypothetical protein
MFVEEKKLGEPAVEQQEGWRRLLEIAADLLETKGWCQNTFTDFDGSYCAVGAVSEATARFLGYQDGDYHDALRRLSIVAGQGGFHAYHCIPFWNDSPGQTKENVITTMRRAARA